MTSRLERLDRDKAALSSCVASALPQMIDSNFIGPMLTTETQLHATGAGILDNSTHGVRSQQYRGEIKSFLKKDSLFPHRRLNLCG